MTAKFKMRINLCFVLTFIISAGGVYADFCSERLAVATDSWEERGSELPPGDERCERVEQFRQYVDFVRRIAGCQDTREPEELLYEEAVCAGTVQPEINECATGTHTCEHICVDTRTGYYCECPEGYRTDRVDNHRCFDINECAEGTHTCSDICTNTQGSYKCSCPEGFRKDPYNEDHCIDIDECQDAKRCDQVCTNHNGGFSCSCRSGYRELSNKCVDIDECAEGTNNCGGTCINTDGSFQCSCGSNFRADASGNCVDIDECAEGKHQCEQKCENTIGGYECSCRKGFVVNSRRSYRCSDVDECEGDDYTCEQFCVNKVGSYECSCMQGYAVSKGDPSKCVKRQEPVTCEEKIEDCRENFQALTESEDKGANCDAAKSWRHCLDPLREDRACDGQFHYPQALNTAQAMNC